MEKTPKDEFLEFTKAMGILAGFGGKVYRDKQFTTSDLQYLLDLGLNFETIRVGFEGVDKVKDLLHGMEKQDLVEMLTALWEAGDQYEKNRQG